MKFDLDELIMWGLMVACVAVIALGVVVIAEDARKWETFSVAHNCKKVGWVSGSTQNGVGFGITGNGQVGTVITMSSAPSKTGWLCDDGVTYWR